MVESACAALLSLSMEEENIETMRQSNSMALLVCFNGRRKKERNREREKERKEERKKKRKKERERKREREIERKNEREKNKAK